jgi:hypothetical protein
MTKGHKPAGGIASKNVTHKPVRTGPGARSVNVRWPASVGGSRGNRAQNALDGGGGVVLRGVRPEPYKGPSFNPVPQGNAVAAATVCGPGGSREVFKSGSQRGLADRQNSPKGRPFDQKG